MDVYQNACLTIQKLKTKGTQRVIVQYQQVNVADIRLVTPDLPTGATVAVLGRSNMTDPFRLLHVFAGPTFDLQLLGFAPKHPWRAIRYVRVLVPASPTAPLPWISMREIQVYGPTAKKRR